jgi:hypothetical protein
VKMTGFDISAPLQAGLIYSTRRCESLSAAFAQFRLGR